MLFTYKDKGPATVFAYPSNQRPMTRYDTISNTPGKPNPIKQWRKQLMPSVTINHIQSHPTIQTLDNAIRTSQPSQINKLCNSYEDVYFINKCIGVADVKPCATGSFNIPRSANTVINKNFCWNNKQYLERRCKTYDQNQTVGKHIEENEYFSASGACIDPNITCNTKKVIYKPNNKPFKQQGGVSSSARIAKLKYDTISTSTNKYDSLLANLDQSAHILNRKPTPCRGWRVKGKRPYDKNSLCRTN